VGDEIITEQDRKVEAFSDAYEDLLGSINTRQHTIDLGEVGVQTANLQELEEMFTEHEVWATIKGMPADRAPGPDGFCGAFYVRAWPVIKTDIMACLAKLGVGDGRGFARLNRALITLIPKKPDAETISDYRPISLVHSFAKLFSKLVANRLRLRLGEVVSSNQSAFIKGRCLHDNFMLVRQVARRINTRRQKGVLLKLDLSRAFDTMSWSFLFEVLRHMGFGELFLRWIALLLQTANTRVTVNGVPGRRFVHTRGLRQGDPTSPMLFVIGMEVLTAMVVKAVEDNLLGGLAGTTALQRISIYADDVVFFCKPVEEELTTIKRIMELFGEATGLRVNYNKTTATMIRGTEEELNRTKAIIGCRSQDFPIKYLGLQLALRPLTKAEWQPMLDAVVHTLPAWQRGLIARAGRLTLINAVMLARPIHHIIVEDPPKWLLEEVEKHLRGFFWVGKKRANGGQCLVAWDNISKPKRYGGLGVKDLRLQGLALRVRWEWLRRTDESRPWQGLNLIADAKAQEVFRSFAKLEVGAGTRIFFWQDRWITGRCVQDIAPLVLESVATRRKNSRTVADALLNNTWLSDIGPELSLDGWAQCINLWEEIELVERDGSRPDRFAWIGAANGVYSAKDTYRLLCMGQEVFSMHDPIWNSFAPPKCKIFAWLAVRYRLWTSDRRYRHGLQDRSAACFWCLQEEDALDHVLMRCPYARQVWFGCITAVGLNIVEPNRDSSLESWWSSARELVRRKDRRSFDTLVILIAWQIWKQRNARVFGNTQLQCSTTQLLFRIKEEFELWKLAKRGGEHQIARE
jgi:hypothetical protein